MKVLVSDNLGEAGIRMLREEEGIDVDVRTGLDPGTLKSIIPAYDGLIIRSATKVTEDQHASRWWDARVSAWIMWTSPRRPGAASSL
jgi:phosphoglycerate dehydrogenase-like enzyme